MGILRCASASARDDVVGFAALALGDLCKALRPNLPPSIKDDISLLFAVIDQPCARNAIPNMLRGLALVMDGACEMAMSWAERFWEIAIACGDVEIGDHRRGEIEYLADLVDEVAFGLSSLVRLRSREKTRNANFVEKVKKQVFPWVNRVWELRAFTIKPLFSFCALFEELLVNLGRVVNIHLHSVSVRRLIYAVIQSGDPLLRPHAAPLLHRINGY
jgi:hypothetical protein